jgi:hypothetical protein
MAKTANGVAVEKTEKKEAPQAQGGHGGMAQNVKPMGSKAPSKAEGICLEWTCKAKEARFGFCADHYDQFKFGLIKKSGEMVSDYEKKFEHYVAYLEGQKRAQKAA